MWASEREYKSTKWGSATIVGLWRGGMGCHCITGCRSKAGMSQCRERERERTRAENGGKKKGLTSINCGNCPGTKSLLFFSSFFFSEKCRNCVRLVPINFNFIFYQTLKGHTCIWVIGMSVLEAPLDIGYVSNTDMPPKLPCPCFLTLISKMLGMKEWNWFPLKLNWWGSNS